jgi:hypothetical protein
LKIPKAGDCARHNGACTAGSKRSKMMYGS